MHRVLVLGGGVGGIVSAHRRRQLLPDADEVVLIDRSPVHTFWPSLLWLMSGTRRPEEVVRPFTELETPGIRIVQDEITAVDPKARRLTTRGGEEIEGDALVVALGADLDPTRVPGLADVPGNFYTVAGAEAVWQELKGLARGRVAVVVSRVPFKCPAAPYEAAMLVDGYLRKKRRRQDVEVAVFAAEPAPMGVAGPAVSRAVVDALLARGIAYHPDHVLARVDAAGRRLTFTNGEEVAYDLLAYVPPHVVPAAVAQSGLAAPDGWVSVQRETLETAYPGVFAVGDVTGIPLALGKPLPKAGVFAHREAEAVAATIARRLTGRGREERFDGVGECFIEMGGGIAGFARGNFYMEPLPAVRAYRPGRHWHAAKVAFERHWWASWWGSRPRAPARAREAPAPLEDPSRDAGEPSPWPSSTP